MTIEIGVLIAVVSVVFSILGYTLNKSKETKSESRQDAKIQAQLDYIGKGVDDIRIDLKANEKQLVHLGERVTRVEESSKQAHKRLDKIEQKGDE
ncbi:hypothetical protein [Bacillus sp. 1P02SD]|uniref:hypothetical protein n=1 Tax=Bacillus sp. 1P02SD TaxID=3132264 RepID=UPI00399FF5E5